MPSQPKYRDAQTEKINLNYMYGGSAVDNKLAIPNSFLSSQALDVRTVPSQASVLPGMTAVGTNTTDLIQAMDQDLNGIRWGIGNKGKLYRIDANNNFSVEATLSENGSAGLLYNQVTDQIYIPGQTTVSMYGQVTSGNDGQPNSKLDHFAKSASNAPGCVNLFNPNDGFFDGIARNDASGLAVGITDPSQVTTTTAVNAYNVPTMLTEHTGDFCFFAPDIEPFYSIAVRIASITNPTSSNGAGTGSDVSGIGTQAWSNPGNITSPDTTYATVDTSLGDSHYLEASSFGFNVPTGATILGVELNITRHRSSGGVSGVVDTSVRLVKGGVISGTNEASATGWTTGDLTVTYGGSTDLWGLALTPADVNASNFGAVLAVATNAVAGVASVDYMSITVYYTNTLTLTLHDSLHRYLARRHHRYRTGSHAQNPGDGT